MSLRGSRRTSADVAISLPTRRSILTGLLHPRLNLGFAMTLNHMKKIFKAPIIAAAAIFITALWNKGFVLPSTIEQFIIAAIFITVTVYILIPLSKIILLPFNLLSFGLVSFIFYLFLLHLVSSGFGWIMIKAWHFSGMNVFGLNIPAIDLSYLGNLILSALSITSIINILNTII